ncbi:MAG: hypothetical protein JNN07_29350 [Verrucomicrobiales bacterium]|nr:hypothetical protein [Verrucomicrobiales bacterium]
MTETPSPSRPWFNPWYGVAWAAYVVSMFMPAIPDADGWDCAKASLQMLVEAWKGDQDQLLYGSYTIPNVFMVLSPLLFSLFRSRASNVLWLACATGFSVHVSSFLILCGAEEGWPKSGYFLWLTSFVCLAVGTFKLRRRNLELEGVEALGAGTFFPRTTRTTRI